MYARHWHELAEGKGVSVKKGLKAGAQSYEPREETAYKAIIRESQHNRRSLTHSGEVANAAGV